MFIVHVPFESIASRNVKMQDANPLNKNKNKNTPPDCTIYSSSQRMRRQQDPLGQGQASPRKASAAAQPDLTGRLLTSQSKNDLWVHQPRAVTSVSGQHARTVCSTTTAKGVIWVVCGSSATSPMNAASTESTTDVDDAEGNNQGPEDASAERPTNLDSKRVRTYRDNDVLLVQDKGVEHHPGNVQFRELCQTYGEIYDRTPMYVSHKLCGYIIIPTEKATTLFLTPLFWAVSRMQKRNVAMRLYQHVLGLDPPGRFLQLAIGSAQYATPFSEYLVADEEKVLIKITEILNDRENVEKPMRAAVAPVATEVSLSLVKEVDCTGNKKNNFQAAGQAPPSGSKGGDGSREHPAVTATRRESSVILDPRDTDVLFGRGSPFYNHPGNVKYRKCCSDLREAYLNSSRYVMF
jgi:hypothetical protein